jgi:hypothetical protein
MNSVVVKAAVFLGLLTTAVHAQDLEKGRFEIRASGGINAGGGPIDSPSPSYDLEAAFGLSRFFALTGDYAHDYLPDSVFAFLLPVQANFGLQVVHNRIQEFLGGVRFSLPNHSPITPHLQFSMGAVRRTSDPSPANSRLFLVMSSAQTEFGLAPGAGLDYKLSRHFGVGVDANFVKANRMTGSLPDEAGSILLPGRYEPGDVTGRYQRIVGQRSHSALQAAAHSDRLFDR